MPSIMAAPDRRGARTALLVSSLGFFLITLDILIINVALPRISADAARVDGPDP